MKKRNKCVKARRVWDSKSVVVKAGDVATEGGDEIFALGEIVGEAVDEEKKLALLDSENFVSLEKAKEYWLLGEWEILAGFDLEFLQWHPDRGLFVLLVGSAYLQLKELDKGREYVGFALEWGCSRCEVGQVLVAGIYNVIGRSFSIKRKKNNALLYFTKSVSVKYCSIISFELGAQLRATTQFKQLGIFIPVDFFNRREKKRLNKYFVNGEVDFLEKKTKNQLVVLGMHRSGTSCITGLFQAMGVYFGSEDIALDKTPENPKGYWERRDILKITNEVLFQCNANWWNVVGINLDDIPSDVFLGIRNVFSDILSELNNKPLWIIKDPRFCLLFPLFKNMFSDPIVIHVYRNPIEVALSLEKRGNFPINFGLALWEYYNKKAFFNSKGMRKVIISYNDLISKPRDTVYSLKQEFLSRFNIELKIPNDDLLLSLLDKNLHHNKIRENDMNEWLTCSQHTFFEMIKQDVFLYEDCNVPNISRSCMEILKKHEFYRRGIITNL